MYRCIAPHVTARSVSGQILLLRKDEGPLKSLQRFLSIRAALFWVIKQRIAVIPYRRFGTTYKSLPQGLRKPLRK